MTYWLFCVFHAFPTNPKKFHPAYCDHTFLPAWLLICLFEFYILARQVVRRGAARLALMDCHRFHSHSHAISNHINSIAINFLSICSCRSVGLFQLECRTREFIGFFGKWRKENSQHLSLARREKGKVWRKNINTIWERELFGGVHLEQLSRNGWIFFCIFMVLKFRKVSVYDSNDNI